MYYIYMLRCEDNSIYTGITTNIERRMKEHFSKGNKCAKYTFTHTAERLEKVWTAENKALASKLEYYIKTLSKKQKEELIKDTNRLGEFLENKVDCNEYKIFDVRKKQIIV